MALRTDLAVESLGLNASAGALEGVRSAKKTVDGFAVTEVEVLDARGEKLLGKPRGRYVSVEFGALVPELLPPLAGVICGELERFLPQGESAALVVGLGNRAITPDALGPLAAERTMVTRHLVALNAQRFGALRPTAALAPGVLASTGVEAAELVASAVERVKPGVVIAVDALASAAVERLCAAVQLASSGIVPGSGVGNARAALDASTLGVPVVAVGVPTVVDAATVAEQLCGAPPEPSRYGSLFVTPRDIDRRIDLASRLVGAAISMVLHGVSFDTAVSWVS